MTIKPDKKINKEILEFLETSHGAYFGNLVMELNEDTLTLLEHLIELKRQGLVYKDSDGGKFKLYESASAEEDDKKDSTSLVNGEETPENKFHNRRLFMPILCSNRI